MSCGRGTLYRASLGLYFLVTMSCCQRRVDEPAHVAPKPRSTEGLSSTTTIDGGSAVVVKSKEAGATEERCIVPLSETPPPPAEVKSHCPKDPEGSPPNLPRAVLRFAETAHEVRVEVAKSTEETTRGLMYRTRMGDKEGMLFALPYRDIQTFWMKNTCISLDMMFLDDDGTIVGIVEHAPTLDLGPRGVPCPSRYVLEVNAGYARRNGIRPGHRVMLPTL